MTPYELKKETVAFRFGYWAGFDHEDPTPPTVLKSEIIDYYRGYLKGKEENVRH